MSKPREAYLTAVRALDLLDFNGDLPDPEGAGDDFSFALSVGGELEVLLRFDGRSAAFIVELKDDRSEGAGISAKLAENVLALVHGLPVGRRLSIDGASRVCGSALVPDKASAEELATTIMELGELILALREADTAAAEPSGFGQDLLVLR